MRKTTTEKVFFCRQVYKWNAKWLRSTSMKVKRTKQTLISKTRFKAISFQWPSKTKQVALTDSMIIANTRYSISYLKIIVSIPNELFWNFKNFCLKLKFLFFVVEQFRRIRKFNLVYVLKQDFNSETCKFLGVQIGKEKSARTSEISENISFDI